MVIGHNRPPSLIDFSIILADQVSAWLTAHPVIDTETSAQEAKVFVDRVRLLAKDVDAEKQESLNPLNQKVKEIRDKYKPTEATNERVLSSLKERLGDWLKKQEQERLARLEEARKAAEAAEAKAREAEQIEAEAKDDVSHGAEADVVAATAAADQAFAEYQKAERQAERLEQERSKATGGFSRSLSLRRTETLMVADPRRAVSVMGWTERILEAILTEAREHRKRTGALPEGVKSVTERKVG